MANRIREINDLDDIDEGALKNTAMFTLKCHHDRLYNHTIVASYVAHMALIPKEIFDDILEKAYPYKTKIVYDSLGWYTNELKWCKENCQSDWRHLSNKFYFSSIADCTAFKLQFLE